uniref:Uncharacterized protein n=1 Tax=Parascaris univalens TaxID=6257 RepID=A0A914ZU47_PARUN
MNILNEKTDVDERFGCETRRTNTHLRNKGSAATTFTSYDKMRGVRNAGVQAILCVTPADTIALVLSHDVIVEITLHKHVRLSQIDGVNAAICRAGSVATVHHSSVHIIQQKTLVQFDLVEGARVRATGDTVHVLGVESSTLQQKVHSVTENEVLSHDNFSVATDGFYGRSVTETATSLFLDEAAGGDVLGIQEDKRARCLMLARRALIDMKDTLVSAIVQGVKVKHNVCTGDTRVYCGRNFISLCVATQALTLHSPWIEINVDRTARTRLVRGNQIIETSDRHLHVTQNSMRVDFPLQSSSAYKASTVGRASQIDGSNFGTAE